MGGMFIDYTLENSQRTAREQLEASEGRKISTKCRMENGKNDIDGEKKGLQRNRKTEKRNL